MRQDGGYETDFYEWTQDQAAKLRAEGARRVNADIDWENVAEEIESLGRSDLRGAEGHLIRVIEHLLKLEYSPRVEPRSDWEVSVLTHRDDARRILDDSPSLRRKVRTSLAKFYRQARRVAARGLNRDEVPESSLPDEPPYSIEQVLDPDWFPANRHGLE